MLTQIITLTSKGNNSGPLYNVFWSSDCVNYNPLTGSTPVFLPTIGSTSIIDLPTITNCVKLVNNNDLCNNDVIQYIGPPTTTTTTTTAPTTTTTTLAGTTTTTTAGGTTTTTTLAGTTCYTIETVQSAPNACFDCPGDFFTSTDTILHIFTACSGSEIFPPFGINVNARYSDNSTGSTFFPSGYTSSIIIATSDVQCGTAPTCGEVASPTFLSASVVAVSASITQCCI